MFCSMCEYCFMSRQRRVISISTYVNHSASSASSRVSINVIAKSVGRCFLRRINMCIPYDGVVPEQHQQTWIRVNGLEILVCESVADMKSTPHAIATRLWRCSLGTASWLAQQADVFDGQVVLEVGAGLGLCCLALAAFSTASIIASDINETALTLLRWAAHMQALKLDTIMQVDVEDMASPLPSATWLIACDVMYTPHLAVALARRCAEQLRNGGHVLVTDPDRKPREVFQSTLNKLQGLHCHFIRLQDAPSLRQLVNEATNLSSPALVLLIVDEHCRPPFI